MNTSFASFPENSSVLADSNRVFILLRICHSRWNPVCLMAFLCSCYEPDRKAASIANISLGIYFYDCALHQHGMYRYSWVEAFLRSCFKHFWMINVGKFEGLSTNGSSFISRHDSKPRTYTRWKLQRENHLRLEKVMSHWNTANCKNMRIENLCMEKSAPYKSQTQSYIFLRRIERKRTPMRK